MYLVFAYNTYYPSGGVNDLQAVFENEIIAIDKAVDFFGFMDHVQVIKVNFDKNLGKQWELIYHKDKK